MSATVLITFGALLGLASGLQLLFISIIEVAVACLNFWIVEHIFKVVSLTILLRLLIVFISVTLYSPHSKIYTVNLVLRHSVTHFPLNCGDIAS